MVPLDFIENKFCKPSGILVSFDISRHYQWIIRITLLVTVVYIWSEAAFYVTNLDDLNESTACLGTLSFAVTSLVRVVWLLVKNGKLKDLIYKIRYNHQNRISARNVSLAAEKRSRRYSVALFAAAYLTLLIMMITPPINMYLEYRSTGKVVKTRWDLPFKMLFPFDHKTPTLFPIVYGYVVVSIFPYMNPIISVDVLFLGCALHIAAFFKDLQRQALTLDFPRLTREDHGRFLENIRSFVDQHNRIIDLVREMEEIFGVIFIVQYMGAMFAICTQAYLSLLNVENGHFLQNILYMLTITFELYIYTYMGSQIMTESENLANVVWSLQWYEKEPKVRFYYQQILQRCQKPCRILAIKWIPSSLTSFKGVISISFNLFTLLRSMNGSSREPFKVFWFH